MKLTPSTIEYYRSRRESLLLDILKSNGWKTPQLQILFCEGCGDFKCEVEELHIHHVDQNGDVSKAGGWQALYSHEDDFNQGENLKVLCKSCHLSIHSRKSFIEEDINA